MWGGMFLTQEYKKEVRGKEKLAIEAFAQAMLAIPKTLAANAGLDAEESILNLIDEYEANKKQPVGLNLNTGKVLSPAVEGAPADASSVLSMR